jgi:serine/threonine protein kinase
VKGSKKEFAVKMIDMVETPLAEIKEEVRMLEMLSHPCVIRLRDVYYEKVFVCLVMDVYKGGDLIEGMQRHWEARGMIPIKVVQDISKQMIDGIAWLHSKNVVHRDVKGDNLLMDRKMLQDPNCKVFLSDFGTVKEVKPGERLNTKCGTQIYWSPEFFNMDYSLKVDIWALGVIMFGLISGRFPFKGEQSVKKQAITLPSRCPNLGSEFVLKMLDRDEEQRFTAAEAAAHPFIASATVQDYYVPTPKNFVPEVKESGANAGIAERRRDLVERMEVAHEAAPIADKARGSGHRAPIVSGIIAALKEQSFEVVDKHEERSSKYEWWDVAKAQREGLLNFESAGTAQDSQEKSNAGKSAGNIKSMLKEYGVKTDKFGVGNAKTFDEFQLELQGGSARLMLDATKHKQAVRVVDIVLLRIVVGDGASVRYLVQTAETFPDGRSKADVNQLPGTKKEPHENTLATAKRVLESRLGIASSTKIKWDFVGKESFEEEEGSSTSYPGVRTVYRKEIIEGAISESDIQSAAALGWKDRKFSFTDSKKYIRTYSWLTQKDCETGQVKLRAEGQNEVSVLVNAPTGFDQEQLDEYLKANKIDEETADTGSTRTLKHFSDELFRGEAGLVKGADGKIVRSVDVVILCITRDTGEILVQASETSNGQTKTLNRLPAVKRRPDENMFWAAHRVLSRNLKIDENAVDFESKNVKVMDETTSSTSYFGLPTKYRRFVISATAGHASI